MANVEILITAGRPYQAENLLVILVHSRTESMKISTDFYLIRVAIKLI